MDETSDHMIFVSSEEELPFFFEYIDLCGPRYTVKVNKRCISDHKDLDTP